ncbi:MAG: hypothetical protein PVH45_05570, partial [Candidatus Omnitrophota bacterium]
LIVIAFSSLIIGMVLVSTVIGSSLYIEWKNNSFVPRYRDSISKLTAEMFKNDVNISNVSVRIEEEGTFSGTPYMEASLKNNSQKTIASILIETSFVRPDGSVVYKDWLHPIDGERFTTTTLLRDIEHTRSVLLPGESISFRHLFMNCPPEVVSQLSSKTGFAKTGGKGGIKLEYTIAGLTVL